MQNDLKYTVRSREIVDLVAAMRNGTLTLSPYFQRNLVWRDAHKRDFIETILKGYPFPQIFLTRGPIDVDTMLASQAIVDGQQRLSAIRDFVGGKIEVDGNRFQDLSIREREDFLKYEVAVIDFDLDASDPRLKDIFHRLNRTYYSLSSIERIASEYSSSEFMLVARVLSGSIVKSPSVGDEFLFSDEDSGYEKRLSENIFSRDPGIDDETWNWMVDRAGGAFSSLILEKPIFSKFEFDRKVPIMFTLNIMCSIIYGYYQRNDRVRQCLDEWSDNFDLKYEVIESINDSGSFVARMRLKNDSIWWNKANLFTLIVELARNVEYRHLSVKSVAEALNKFHEQLPREYALAAREAVNGKAQRELRGRMVRQIFESEELKSLF